MRSEKEKIGLLFKKNEKLFFLQTFRLPYSVMKSPHTIFILSLHSGTPLDWLKSNECLNTFCLLKFLIHFSEQSRFGAKSRTALK